MGDIFEVASSYLKNRIPVGEPAFAPYLYQNRYVPPIHGETHSFRERYAAVDGAFSLAVPPQAVRSARILIFDDVLTTGATVSATADALLKAGAESVDAIVLTRTPHRYSSRR